MVDFPTPHFPTRGIEASRTCAILLAERHDRGMLSATREAWLRRNDGPPDIPPTPSPPLTPSTFRPTAPSMLRSLVGRQEPTGPNRARRGRLDDPDHRLDRLQPVSRSRPPRTNRTLPRTSAGEKTASRSRRRRICPRAASNAISAMRCGRPGSSPSWFRSRIVVRTPSKSSAASSSSDSSPPIARTPPCGRFRWERSSRPADRAPDPPCSSRHS